MLRVDIKNAMDGMDLALPVFNPAVPDQILLRVGYSLTDEIIGKLQTLGIRSVWVQYPNLEFLDKFINLETMQAQSEIVSKISETFEALQGESTAKLNYGEYTEAIAKLIDHMISNPQSAVFLGDIASSSNELMRHSSAVTYLSLLMGLKLEGYIVRERKHVDPARAKEIQNLGLGAMLHDIGIMQLPPEVCERYGATGDENDPAWREHTALGYHMVHGHISPTAASVVLHHHQRFDGSGWVGHEFEVAREKKVHVFPRIVALADQFDIMRNPPGLPPQPTVWVLGSLLSSSLIKQFDPQAISALLAVVPPYPPGSILRLSDKRYVVCVDYNPAEPCRPIVQQIPEPGTVIDDNMPSGQMIDLREMPKRLCVVEADGQDVAEFNFERPEQISIDSPAAAWM